MILHRIGVLTAIGLMTPALCAKPSVVVTLSSIGDRVRAQNPDLAAARQRIREALGGARTQAGRLDNPEFETGIEHDSRFREGRVEMGITRVPGHRATSTRTGHHAHRLEAAEAEVRNVERRLAAEAAASLVEVLATRERRALLAEQSGLTEELAASIQRAAEIEAPGRMRTRVERCGSKLARATARRAGNRGSWRPQAIAGNPLG